MPISTKENVFSTSLNKISKYFEIKNNIEIPNVRVSVKNWVPYSLRSSRKKGMGRERGKKPRALPSLPPTPLPFSMPATQAKSP